MNRTAKMNCECGGQYRYADKARHLRTKRHIAYTTPVSQVDVLFQKVMLLSIRDRFRLSRMIVDEVNSPFDRLRDRLIKELGTCPFKNHESGELTDEEWDKQDDLMEAAGELITEDEADLFEDCCEVFKLKNYSEPAVEGGTVPDEFKRKI